MRNLMKLAFKLGQDYETKGVTKGGAREFAKLLRANGMDKAEADAATTDLLHGWDGWLKKGKSNA